MAVDIETAAWWDVIENGDPGDTDGLREVARQAINRLEECRVKCRELVDEAGEGSGHAKTTPGLDTNGVRESIPIDIRQHYWIRRLLEALAEIDRQREDHKKELKACRESTLDEVLLAIDSARRTT